MHLDAAQAAPGRGPKGRVTIADVAAATGLTKGTVSRALNDYPDISERTRRLVRRAADRMGYAPLSQAQAIRTGRARSLGLVIQISEHDAHAPFLTDFLAGVTQAASAQSWTLAVASALSDDDMIETLRRMVAERKADGFILPRTRVSDPRIAWLRAAGVPFVLYGRTADPAGCAWFDILGEEAMREAVERLAGMGHRRIGFVNGAPEYYYCTKRAEGYRAGLAAAGLPQDPALIQGDARWPSQGAAATRALLALPEPPTAIVFATDEAAMGAYGVAEELGLVIGRDLSIIGYDGIPEGRFARPVLSTYRVDTRAAGMRLASLLIELIRGAEPEDLREMARAQLERGGSDGPPARTPGALAHYLSEFGQDVARVSRGNQPDLSSMGGKT